LPPPPLANSQNNESANNIIASKAPNSRYYGESESSDFRVATVICQKNIGRAYIPTVLERLPLFSGQTRVSFTQNEDKVGDRQAVYKCAVTKHRCVLQNLRSTEQNCQEVREGVAATPTPKYLEQCTQCIFVYSWSYQSTCEANTALQELRSRIEVTYEHDCGLEDDGPDELEIPSVTCKPKLEVCENIDYDEVCFDLETSKGGYSAKITQLSAVASEVRYLFYTYILPKYHI
jgi:hypothetical protein